jgi:hypothetical protein
MPCRKIPRLQNTDGEEMIGVLVRFDALDSEAEDDSVEGNVATAPNAAVVLPSAAASILRKTTETRRGRERKRKTSNVILRLSGQHTNEGPATAGLSQTRRLTTKIASKTCKRRELF